MYFDWIPWKLSASCKHWQNCQEVDEIIRTRHLASKNANNSVNWHLLQVQSQLNSIYVHLKKTINNTISKSFISFKHILLGSTEEKTQAQVNSQTYFDSTWYTSQDPDWVQFYCHQNHHHYVNITYHRFSKFNTPKIANIINWFIKETTTKLHNWKPVLPSMWGKTLLFYPWCIV